MRGAGLLLLLLLLLGTALLWRLDYEAFAALVLRWAGKQEWRAFFEERLFPVSRYALLRQLVPLLCLGWGLALYFLWSILKNWGQQLGAIQASFLTDFQNLRQGFRQQQFWFRGVVLLLFSIFALLQFYGAASQPLQYDESWTYQHFSHKGPVVALISPHNNHLLYSFQSALLDFIPFLPTLWVIRLPVVLTGLLSFWLFYFFLQWRWGDARVLWALAFWAFTPPSYFYQFLGRGYGLLLFFALLGFAALWLWWKRPDKPYALPLLALACVGGVYGNLAFLYPMLAYWMLLGLGFLARPDWRQFWLLLKMALFSIGILLLLHLPQLLINGMEPVFQAAQPVQDRSNFWPRFVDFWASLSDWTWAGTRWPQLHSLWAAVLLFVGWSALRQRSAWYCSIGFMLAYPLLLFLWTGIQTPPRLWCFLGIFWALVVAEALGAVPLFKKPGLVLLISLGLMGSQAFQAQRHIEINWSYELDLQAKELAKLLKEKQIHQLYCRVRYEKPLLDYYALDMNFPLEIAMPFEASKDYQSWEANNWQAVLWDLEHPKQGPHPEGLGYEKLWEAGRLQLWVHPDRR